MTEFRPYMKRPTVIHARKMDEPFVVETLEGTMRGKAGDYLVRGIRGEEYICDAAIFEALHDPHDSA